MRRGKFFLKEFVFSKRLQKNKVAVNIRNGPLKHVSCVLTWNIREHNYLLMRKKYI